MRVASGRAAQTNGAANDPFTFKWNMDDVEVKSKRVEQQLAPLIQQVTSLANGSRQDGTSSGGGSTRRRGKHTGAVAKADVLVAGVERAILRFITVGQAILKESTEQTGGAHTELAAALTEVEHTGSNMVQASDAFAKEPCMAARRTAMTQAARELLGAVTRFMCVADMIDVQALLAQLQHAQAELDAFRANATTQNEMHGRYDALKDAVDRLADAAGLRFLRRADDLRSADERDDMLAARAILRTHMPILYTATKTCIRLPDASGSNELRDYAISQLADALKAMNDVIQGAAVPPGVLALAYGQIGKLMEELDRFCQQVYVDPQQYQSGKHRVELEQHLEDIVSRAAHVADAPHTRPDRRDRIVHECNSLRAALQTLLAEYERNVNRKEPSEDFDMALAALGTKSRDLKRHLRRAVVDHVSDAFLDVKVPLALLIERASSGDVDGTERAGVMFSEHAHKLVDVARLAAAIAPTEQSAKMVLYTAAAVHKLAPQVVHAARILSTRPESQEAQENMDAFAQAWERQVQLLVLAVDSVISVDDFLAVSEAHIVEDVKQCIQSAHNKDADALDRTAGALRGRAVRVCTVVQQDLALRPNDHASERVQAAVHMLRENALPKFASVAEHSVRQLHAGNEIDVERFIDAATLLHEAIGDIRTALLMNRHPADIDSDEEYTEDNKAPSAAAGSEQQNEGDNARAVMRQLPEQDKKKIQEQIDVFKVVATKFEREVAKWDDTGNDIIVLAKYMCMIMMEMTDFTRGRGPLTSTMDVIGAARKISEAGGRLNGLAERIASECVASETKKDLVAYMQRITLHCHQLNITSKVKADVQQVGDEVVVSGLESAMSLIQTARNLLNAVVLTVKSAYIASTMYPAKNGKASNLVVWKMRAPEKKPLYYRGQSNPEDQMNGNSPDKAAKSGQRNAIIRRASNRREMPPIKALAEFDAA